MPTSPLIMTSGTPREVPTQVGRRSDTEWVLLGGVGAAFVVLGLMDQALVWYPWAFGSPEWEYGSVTAALNGLPVTVLGGMLLLASGVARRQRVLTRGVAILFVVLALIVLTAAVLYATTVPIALGKVTNGVVRTGLFKSTAKTLAQCAVYPLLFLWLAFKGWKAARSF
jgi:hypothetical protein